MPLANHPADGESKPTAAVFNTVSGKKLAVLGFAYKKNTSDTRCSVAIDVCKALLAEKATLSVHDPRVSQVTVQPPLSQKCIATK